MDATGRILEFSPPAQPGKNESRDPRDWRYALVCGAATLAAIALTWPIAESGVVDDWSYAKTALELAQTGQFKYNGWAAAMLGAQAYWGALFIKLFGFSFLAVRLSTAPLAAGCAVLTYGLHRRAGLPPRLALFGALTLTLSPVFVPNAASFMTEIPGLFLFLASVYGYVRVADILLRSKPAGNTTGPPWAGLWKWLVFALAAGLLAGTVRQVYWLVPILAPLYLCIRAGAFRSSARTLLPLMLSTILACAGGMACSFWFSAQPYAIHEQVAQGLRAALHWKGLVALDECSIRIVITLGAMALPAAIALPWLLPRWRGTERRPWGFALQALALTLILYHLVVLALDRNLFPWLGNTGNMFVRDPLFFGLAPTPFGDELRMFSRRFWRFFSVCVISLTCGSMLMVSLMLLRRRHRVCFPLSSVHRLAVCLDGVPVPLALLVIFAAAYIPVILLKSVVPDSSGVFDRYLLPILPGVTLLLLIMFHRESGWNRLPSPAWLVLILFASYGIAQTHDYFAQLRARLVLAEQLEGRGISRTRIMGGFEYDAWTQITVAGHYNDTRIRKPRGAYTPTPPPPFETTYTLWKHTPVIRPDYVVSLGHHPDLLDTDLPPAEFHCWLPPFRRGLIVQTRDRGLIHVRSIPLRGETLKPEFSATAE